MRWNVAMIHILVPDIRSPAAVPMSVQLDSPSGHALSINLVAGK